MNSGKFFKFHLSSLYILILLSTFYVINCGSEFKSLLEEPEPLQKPVSTYQVHVLYWAQIGGIIKSIRTDGTDERTVVNASGSGDILDIALYTPDNKIYWSMYSSLDGTFQIRRAGTDGSVEELFYENANSSDHGPTAIAIDPVNAEIYWNQYQSVSSHNDIWRSSITQLFPEKWENTISKPYTYGICVDTLNRKIYFTANYYWNINLAFGSGYLGHVYIGDLDSANSYSSTLVGTGPEDPSMPFKSIAVDSNNSSIYYIDNTTNLCIMKADLSLRNPVESIISTGFGIQNIALDTENGKIYWTSNTDNSIYRADLDKPDSNIEKFIQLSNSPTGITIDQSPDLQ